jgi:hypothetical protein
MWHRRRARLLRRLVLGLAIVAVAAPVAQARNDEGAVAPSDEVVQGVPTRGDDKVGLDVWQITGIPVHADDKVGLQPSTSPTLVAHPDNRAVRTGPGYEGTVGAEYRQYAYRGMLPSDYGRSNVIVAVDRTDDGFDWGDAGIGAGTLFAIGLLAAGAFVLNRHLSRPATA